MIMERESMVVHLIYKERVLLQTRHHYNFRMSMFNSFFSCLFLIVIMVTHIYGLDQNPDTYLHTPDLATKYGYPIESHRVVTDDGYILEMHRIPYGRYQNGQFRNDNRRIPIILQHGLAGSSADWVLSGPNKALAYILADDGYDVWLGNNRGNIYSRQHRDMQPNNRTFWNYSYHELGIYDLPAMIDHVLTTTSRSKLLYTGHSQGVTQFLVMTSVRTDYNFKIVLAVGLAPAAYTGHLRGPITQLAKLTEFGVWVGETFGYPEFGSRSMWAKFIANLFCHGSTSAQFLCHNTLFMVTGFNYTGFDMNNLTVISGHVPAGASWKQVVHFGQGYINPGHFRPFDYGKNSTKNLELYNSLTPPEYQLDKITAPIALFSSDKDWLATTEDVALLRSRLQNVIIDYKVHPNTFTHYDFLWGTSAVQYLFPKLQDLLARYR